MSSVSKHENLIAFLALIAAIVVLSLFGVKDLAVITGLVGVLGTFKARSPSTDQEAATREAIAKIPPTDAKPEDDK